MPGCSGKGEPVVTGPPDSVLSHPSPLFPSQPPPLDLTMPIAGKALATVCPDPQMSHSLERVKLKLAPESGKESLGSQEAPQSLANRGIGP